MNTETILAVVIAVVVLIDIAFRIYIIRNINKRLSKLEERQKKQAEDIDFQKRRIKYLRERLQPTHDQPEVKAGYDDGATTYEPTYYPLWIQSEEFKRLLVIQSNPEVKYWFKNKEVTFEQLKDILESLNGLSEPRIFVNVYKDDSGRYISMADYSSTKEAYDERDNLSTYLETVEIIRHKKAPRT